MFSYLKGIIAEKGEGYVTVECGGVGFEVLVSNRTLSNLKQDEIGKIYTYLQVRDDGMSLFGFDSKEEKMLFNKLIGVSGVGCKSAINILSNETVERLIYFIASSDISALSKIKGIGKKTAERIIVELRDKVEATSIMVETAFKQTPNLDADAVLGLMSLGFTRVEAENSVEKAMNEGATDLEKIIALALKRSAR